MLTFLHKRTFLKAILQKFKRYSFMCKGAKLHHCPLGNRREGGLALPRLSYATPRVCKLLRGWTLFVFDNASSRRKTDSAAGGRQWSGFRLGFDRPPPRIPTEYVRDVDHWCTRTHHNGRTGLECPPRRYLFYIYIIRIRGDGGNYNNLKADSERHLVSPVCIASTARKRLIALRRVFVLRFRAHCHHRHYYYYYTKHNNITILYRTN